MKKNEPLPTAEAIYLYMLSLRGPIAITCLSKQVNSMSQPSREIASKIINNSNPKYRKQIPPCKNPDRFNETVAVINALLSVAPLYASGQKAVEGYLYYAGVLTSSRTAICKWKE